MRFQQFIEQDVNEVVARQFNKMKSLAASIPYGWESWLQVELFLRLTQGGPGLDSFVREPYYPGSPQRADFNFVPSNADDTTTWVELKVELHSDPDNAVDRFIEDYVKVRQVHVPPTDTVGAAVVIPLAVDDAIAYAKSLFGHDADRIWVYLVASDGGFRRYSLRDDPMIQDEIMVMYYSG